MAKKYAIPDRLIAVVRPPAQYPQAYTDIPFTVRPAFVTDANTNLLDTARKWAGSPLKLPSGDWDMTPTFDEVSLDNTPLTKLTVLGIDHRREGGVALKVLTEQGWLVDLREEEFMEATLTGALHAGVITGSFVWSRGVNQMRLVRVGSRLYNDRLAFGNGVS